MEYRLHDVIRIVHAIDDPVLVHAVGSVVLVDDSPYDSLLRSGFGDRKASSPAPLFFLEVQDAFEGLSLSTDGNAEVACDRTRNRRYLDPCLLYDERKRFRTYITAARNRIAFSAETRPHLGGKYRKVRLGKLVLYGLGEPQFVKKGGVVEEVQHLVTEWRPLSTFVLGPGPADGIFLHETCREHVGACRCRVELPFDCLGGEHLGTDRPMEIVLFALDHAKDFTVAAVVFIEHPGCFRHPRFVKERLQGFRCGDRGKEFRIDVMELCILLDFTVVLRLHECTQFGHVFPVHFHQCNGVRTAVRHRQRRGRVFDTWDRPVSVHVRF